MSKDYYKILGVAEFETAENIKIAYRKLARRCHPDIAGESAEALLRFKEINEAYEILSNKIKKEEYDRARRFYNYAKDNSKKTSDVNKKVSEPDNDLNKKSFNFNWEKFFSSKIKESFSTKSEKKDYTLNGKDVYTDIEISIFEAMSGVVKTISMLQTQICPKCNGRKFANTSLCPHCKGKGEISEYKKLNVKIPSGIANNSKIRLSGEGEQGKNGGKNGDLYITIKIKEPKTYKTEGLNIYKTIPITPYEAVLGANISISTINGKFTIKLPARAQNGQKIRLNNCGLVQNNKIGDMIITLEIQIPKNLSEEELSLYKKLEEISSHNIREI